MQPRQWTVDFGRTYLADVPLAAEVFENRTEAKGEPAAEVLTRRRTRDSISESGRSGPHIHDSE